MNKCVNSTGEVSASEILLTIDSRIKKEVYYMRQLTNVFNGQHPIDEFSIPLGNDNSTISRENYIVDEVEIISKVVAELGLELKVKAESTKRIPIQVEEPEFPNLDDQRDWKYSVVIYRSDT
ncbi:MAG TPA: hypothetical protein VI815_03385 [Candidatus Nanoarchaeia archaeon]|nr:hypothetical protein [Candidatus Nanoarchaeia archaeon]